MASFKACKTLEKKIAEELKSEMLTLYKERENIPFKLDAKMMGERALKNTALHYLGYFAEYENLAQKQFDQASNMTEEIAALKVLTYHYQSEEALDQFLKRWSDEGLIIQKWFRLIAAHPSTDVAKLKEIEQSEHFDFKVPNIVRSVFGVFIGHNLKQSMQNDAIEYIFEKIYQIDKITPQLSSSLGKSLRFISRLPKEKQQLIRSHIKTEGVSPDLKEVLESYL